MTPKEPPMTFPLSCILFSCILRDLREIKIIFSDRVFSTGLVRISHEEQSFWSGTMTVTPPSLASPCSASHRMKTVSFTTHLLNKQCLLTICIPLVRRTQYVVYFVHYVHETIHTMQILSKRSM